MRTSATSSIASAAHASHPAANTAAKSDDAGRFALMLAASGSQSGAAQDNAGTDSSDDNVAAQTPAQASVTTSFQIAMQAAASAPKKDSEPDAAANDDTAQGDTTSADNTATTVDPSSLIALTMPAPVPPATPAPLTSANDADAPVTSDQSAALSSSQTAPREQGSAPQAQPTAQPTKPAHAQQDANGDQTLAQPQAPQDPSQLTPQQMAAAAAQPVVPPQAQSGKQTQPGQTTVSATQAVAQPQQAQAIASVAPDIKAAANKPVTKPGKDSNGKVVTADANDSLKASKSGATTNTNTAADIQAAKADAKPDENQPTDTPAQPVQANASTPVVPSSDATVGGIAAPQGQQTTAQAAAPQFAGHVQVTAQPHANFPALAADITAKSQSGARQFDIRLDPPELGHVEVRLSIDATGKASAHLSADQPQTLDLLQKDSSSLTRALRDAGLDVSQGGLNFSLRQQANNSNDNSAFSGGNMRGNRTRLAAGIDTTTTNATSAYRAPLDGRLDIRV